MSNKRRNVEKKLADLREEVEKLKNDRAEYEISIGWKYAIDEVLKLIDEAMKCQENPKPGEVSDNKPPEKKCWKCWLLRLKACPNV